VVVAAGSKADGDGVGGAGVVDSGTVDDWLQPVSSSAIAIPATHRVRIPMSVILPQPSAPEVEPG
jgi:hypothetical protein